MMQDLLERFGLPALFVGVALEGDVTMILGGVAAHLGLLEPAAVFVVGAAGAAVSDLAWFGLGRSHAAFIRNSALYRSAGPAIERIADRLGALQVGLSRFIFGTRIATMILWGLRGLSLWRFTAADLPGCLIWAAVFGGLGFAASDSAAALLGQVKRVRLWLLCALLLAGVVFAVIHWIGRRRLTHWRPPGPVA